MSAARRSSSTARRSLLTATAAGALLGALWFVPSANATQDSPEQQTSTTTRTTSDTEAEAEAEAEAGTDADAAGPHTRLADTGSFDTTPYVIGGTLFLSLGAGFVAYSVRRERTTAY
ncbi:LPXTG cell wall anchor domain-containing protein [Streptomyces sp. NPDC002845]